MNCHEYSYLFLTSCVNKISYLFWFYNVSYLNVSCFASSELIMDINTLIIFNIKYHLWDE